MIKKKLLILVLLITNLICILPTNVYAQDDVVKSSFAVSPPSFEITANPGDVLTNTIKVENLSEQSLEISAKPENFVAYGDGGQVSLTEETTTFAIDKWVSIDKTSAIIQPKEFEIFSFTINIPSNTEPGSHYGAVVFSTNVATDSVNGALVEQQIGSLILIKIPGEVVEEAKLNSFDSEKSYYTDNTLKFNALVENIGSVHTKLNGYIYVRDILGNVIKTIDIAGKNILPGSKRTFDESFDFENIGIYKVDLELFYKNGEKVVRGETQIITLNLPKTIPTVLIIVGIIILYIIFRKRINKAIKVILKG